MTLQTIQARLTAGATSIQALTREVSEEQTRWKPAQERWSILEVINHLADEEREDFRMRLDLLLHESGRDWPGIDPQGWVQQREYAKRDPQESLQRFLEERDRSLAWVATLRSPDWGNYHEHPVAGRIHAGDMLASWLAHDHLHIRQLARLHYDYMAELTGGYSPAYAGEW